MGKVNGSQNRGDANGLNSYLAHYLFKNSTKEKQIDGKWQTIYTPETKETVGDGEAYIPSGQLNISIRKVEK